MKNFFENLFGKKAAAEDGAKRPTVAGSRLTPESFQPYQIGDVIAGKYEVRRVLGKGAFGIVYQVRFRETGEDFALKTFKDELTSDSAALEAFKKEVLVLGESGTASLHSAGDLGRRSPPWSHRIIRRR